MLRILHPAAQWKSAKSGEEEEGGREPRRDCAQCRARYYQPTEKKTPTTLLLLHICVRDSGLYPLRSAWRDAELRGAGEVFPFSCVKMRTRAGVISRSVKNSAAFLRHVKAASTESDPHQGY